MESASIGNNNSNIVLKDNDIIKEKDVLNLDQKSMNDLITQFDNLKKDIQIHKEKANVTKLNSYLIMYYFITFNGHFKHKN